jgi:hypothetical protein
MFWNIASEICSKEFCRNFSCSILSSALINQRGHSREEKAGEEDDLPRYRDRAKERREDVNPDYDATTAELGSLHAVAPPGTVDLRIADAHRISIENSKFLGGASVNLLDVSIFHWLISMVHFYLQPSF